MIPGFELQGRELIRFRHRERHDFLHHGVSFESSSNRAVGSHLGVQQHFNLSGDLPDSWSQDEEVQDPMFPFFRDAGLLPALPLGDKTPDGYRSS
eukprot:4236110-Heterocapsa_arctica.AAC.1